MKRALLYILAPLWVPILCVYFAGCAVADFLSELWRDRRTIG